MPSKPLPPQKNLLLCLDAFGTLFKPSTPIPIAYARAAARHGIHIPDTEALGKRFKEAFKKESEKNPNYGKATGMGAEKWWGNIIHTTITPYLTPTQPFPEALIPSLLQHFSSSAGYTLYPDVLPFFSMLRAAKAHHTATSNPHTPTQSPPGNAVAAPWPWTKTVVGIITNSDSRVPSILSSFGGLTISPRRFNTPTPSSPSSFPEEDISFTVLSYDVGFQKPSPQIFRAAEQMLLSTLSSSSSKPADYEKLHIGDDTQKDYYGAHSAGWSSVLLQRDLSPSPSGKDSKDRGGTGSEKEKEKINITRVKDDKTGSKLCFEHTAKSLMDLQYWRPEAE